MARGSPPSDDPATPPHPDGGWSHGLWCFPGAVVNRLSLGYLVHPAGVFDAEGNIRAEAVHWRGRPLMTPPPPPLSAAPLAGRWLWGGVLMDHFGHFIMESLGRLWALERERVDGILFLPEDGFDIEKDQGLKAWQRQFLGLLGVDLPVKVMNEPTRVEELVVPGQGFGIGPLIGGTAPFRAFVKGRFARDVVAEGPAKLYLSRAKLAADLGGIVREAALERQMLQAGYEIFHPQDHGLEVQLARYKAATHVVGLDGSSFHLFALVAQPGQRVAVIKRRPGSAPEGIVDHLRGFTGEEPLVLDVIRRNWVRSDRKGADNFSYGELDFRRLGRQLVAGGFLPEDAELRSLPDRKVVEFMQGIERQIGRKKIRFTPLAPNGTPYPPEP